MPLSILPLWKEAPFLRLLTPFITGILLQWYIGLEQAIIFFVLAAAVLVLLGFQATATILRFRLQWLPGVLLNTALIFLGSLVTYCNHPVNKHNWLPSVYKAEASVKAVIQEPLSPKNNSFKALAAVSKLYNHNTITDVSGNIIIYFSHDVKVTDLSYGSIIIINKPLIPVKSSGNPGAFNYQRYCTFAQIGYQVYLKPGEFVIKGPSETRGLKKLIFRWRQQVINILSTYIKGPAERALAEALLIGYKDELDKNLVQSYANTGVIHIIAVSGMHLGIIYWLLSWCMRPLRKHRSAKWLTFICMLGGLWMFSLLAGAGPSVVRSALMFSFILIGDTFSKRNTIYNNLAASAFLLLCWNPFWLWDAGFQLSYASVLSIVVFFRPIYNLIYVQNKLLDSIWKLNAVTIAAQLLTIPLSLYHFHQFPNLFLLANLVAVPLSGILLTGEILLCALSFIPLLAIPLGTGLSFLMSFLNNFIQHIDLLPFASWTQLQLSVLQTILLFVIVPAAAYWLFRQNKSALILTLSTIALFMVLRSHSFIAAAVQRKLIVYNIPGKSAIDLIEGRRYYFTGDPAVQKDAFLRNFHLEPSRTLHRSSAADSLPGLFGEWPLYIFHSKRILIADRTSIIKSPIHVKIDVLILSNPPIPLLQLLQTLDVAQVVADSNNSFWKIKEWQQNCNALNIPFHSVSENGAFILDMK